VRPIGLGLLAVILACGAGVGLAGGGGAVVTSAVWSPQTAPLPTPADNPQPKYPVVVCPAVGTCVAAGAYVRSDNTRQGVLETESGGHWTAVVAPLPAGAAGNPVVNLVALSCPSTTWCAAGGWYTDSDGNGQGLLEVGFGANWTATLLPLPSSPTPGSNPAAEVQGLTCTSVGSCVAVGSYLDDQHSGQGLIVTLDDGTWTPIVAPAPGGQAEPRMSLLDVQCGAPGSCAATGVFVPTGLPQRGVLETLADGSWSAVTAPVPANADDDLGSLSIAVSCPAAGQCTAVGIYDYYARAGDPDHGRGLIDTLSDGSWTATEAPLPPDANTDPGVRLLSISCPTTTFCAAGGYYNTRSRALLETFSQGSWSATSAAGLDTTGQIVTGVTCPAAGWCEAVGGSVLQGLIWGLRNGTWQVSTTPVPPGGNGVRYPGTTYALPRPVACPAVNACTLVASYTTNGNPKLALGLVATLAIPAPATAQGYYQVSSNGAVWAAGRAVLYGVPFDVTGADPVVGMTVSPDTAGYIETTAQGVIYPFGSAQDQGSMADLPLNAPIVGIAYHPGSVGYWQVGGDGGVFNFGLANYYGSMGGQHLNAPVVALVPTPDGQGYWLVAQDGGVFAFGDARFLGSMGGTPLNAPIVGMDSTPDGQGYWLVGRDGGVFAFGDATYFGSEGGQALPTPVTGISALPDGTGYWLFSRGAQIYPFGNAAALGTVPPGQLTAPVVGGAGL
jgi:hypothetical protein